MRERALEWREQRLTRRDPRRFGQNADLDLVAIVATAPRTTCAVDVGRWLATRDRAFRCYRSQLREQRYRMLLPRVIRRSLRAREGYARVLPPVQPGEPAGRNLLTAVTNSR